MKKELNPKKLRKLNLNRETVRQLSELDLTIVAGGATLRCTSDPCSSPSVSCLC